MSAGPGAGGLPDLALSRGEVDRAAARRSDTEWLAQAWADPRTRVLVVDAGRALVRSGGGHDELVFVPAAQAPDGVRFLLGIDAEDVVYFGVAGPLPHPDSVQVPGSEVRSATLREVGPQLSDRDVGLMTHAVALGNWHAVHTHCPRDGAVTEPELAGHARRCVADGSEHFPRLDPAVIMLVTDPEDRCLLARNAMWPEKRVSILAGFVEPGESAEQAVAREVHEETGITVGDVHYVGSQPWPMPHSLMLGFRASATGSLEIRVDAEEIVEAHWFSRDELRAAVASGEIRLPPPPSIAHRIIGSWYGSPIGGNW
ncbi:MAG TPA: NAD(+) diphosphatase [Streptosporangiaceae bacterium]|nr:NAD(+) diphosphatase [Streptosporangiaceae bacterium]